MTEKFKQIIEHKRKSMNPFWRILVLGKDLVWLISRFLQMIITFFLNESKAKTKFVIFAQSRTGGTLLVDLLNSHPKIQCDEEMVAKKVSSKNIFIKDKCIFSKKNRYGFKIYKREVYGFKVMIDQLLQEQIIEDPVQFLADLHKDGWKIIYLRRFNLLRQAISSRVAKHRNKSHRYWYEAPEKLCLSVDCDRLIEGIKKREFYLQREEEALVGLPYLAITYEDHLLNSENHRSTLDKIFYYLETPFMTVKSKHVKITPDKLSDFVENYSELKRFITENKYAKFLEPG